MPLYKVVPLSAGFMLSSMLGGIISAFYVYPQSKTYGLTFFILFTLMFVASIISMTYAPLEVDFDVRHDDVRRGRKR